MRDQTHFAYLYQILFFIYAVFVLFPGTCALKRLQKYISNTTILLRESTPGNSYQLINV